MNATTLFSVAPTFPLDEDHVRARCREKIMGSPVSWGGIGVALLIASLVGGGGIGYLSLLVLAAFSLRSYWLRRWPQLKMESRRELVRASNAAQNRELLRICHQLHLDGEGHYSHCLERIVVLKREIEGEIHQAPSLAGFATEVDKAVDGVCAEVCREITRLCEDQRRLGEVLLSCDEAQLKGLEEERSRSHQAILRAYKTLCQTQLEVQGFEPDTPCTETQEDKRLPEWIRDLRSEVDVMGRTRARIQEGNEGMGAKASDLEVSVV